jgi:SAM-dependent methyltransferase
LFGELIRGLRPRRIIEVGTWLGASAIHMAELCRREGLNDTEIVCVDTWLGSGEDWISGIWKGDLALRNGRPPLYDQFLKNVVLTNNTGYITPLPLPATQAALVLRYRQYQADMIYIDGAHSYTDVIADIRAYYKLVRPGGVIFGDDFTAGHFGVVRAVAEFAESIDQDLKLAGRKWLLEKIAPRAG